MSAFEEAWDAFRGVVDDVELDRLLKGIEREHAHELAERQREYMRTGVLSIAEVISVIDPETEEKRCDMREAHTWHRWTKDGVAYVCKSVALNGGV